MDKADPLSGWPLKSFLGYDAGPAKNDEYGKLHYFLKQLFMDFHARLRSVPVTFELLHGDARHLPSVLVGQHFDRIDVSLLSIRVTERLRSVR